MQISFGVVKMSAIKKCVTFWATLYTHLYLQWPAFSCLDGKQREHCRRYVVVRKLPLLPLPFLHHRRLPRVLVLEKITPGQRKQRTRHTFNPLECEGNYSAITNNIKLVHLPLMGGLLHLVQR